MSKRRNKWGDLIKKHRKKYGHWGIHLTLAVLVIGLWLIPMDILVSEVTEFGAKIRFLSTTFRSTAEELTLSVKSMGTFIAAMAALSYAFYNHKKAK